MKKIILATLVFGLFSAAAAAAPHDRGYLACERAIMHEFRNDGVMANRTYYYKRKDDKLVYFINGSIWNDDGERVAGRATCFTTANGRQLLEFKTEFGSYGVEGNTLVTR